MTAKKARVLSVVLGVVGVAIGGWQAFALVYGAFTMTEQEIHSPLTWIVFLCGPGSTLLAVLVGFSKPKVAGLWLIWGGSLSGIAAMLTSDKPLEALAAVVFFLSGPMIALGYGFLVLARNAKPTASDAGTTSWPWSTF